MHVGYDLIDSASSKIYLVAGHVRRLVYRFYHFIPSSEVCPIWNVEQDLPDGYADITYCGCMMEKLGGLVGGCPISPDSLVNDLGNLGHLAKTSFLAVVES